MTNSVRSLETSVCVILYNTELNFQLNPFYGKMTHILASVCITKFKSQILQNSENKFRHLTLIKFLNLFLNFISLLCFCYYHLDIAPGLHICINVNEMIDKVSLPHFLSLSTDFLTTFDEWQTKLKINK